jgi:hypothetical protein
LSFIRDCHREAQIVHKPGKPTLVVMGLLLAVFVLGIGGPATFGLLWHSETVKASRLTAQRDLGRAEPSFRRC